ncbi:MAG: alpha/beta hydrolase [Gammaproteobacteria bacterium]|nr:alpha/beta hydrolase [Gammaproteobacteria bacterium]
MPRYSSFDQATLDREYSPSSCVDDINVYIYEYVRASHKAKDAAVGQGTCLSDLGYGENSDETLDLFLPDTAAGAPLHIYIHGGYWQALSKNESSFAAPMLQQHGSFFAAINYSLAPAVRLTEIVAQNRRAIAWLYTHAHEWGFDRERIFLSGSSAGAHLTMMMLLTDWTRFGLPENAIKGVCAVSGIYDLEPIRLSYVNELLGLDHQEAQANSPIQQAIRNRCPVILAYGDNETEEFKRQTDDYRGLLLRADEVVSFKEIVGRNHFDVILDLTKSDSWLSQQVLQQMGLV